MIDFDNMSVTEIKEYINRVCNQSKLARYIGISTTKFFNWMSGKNNTELRPHEYVKLIEILSSK